MQVGNIIYVGGNFTEVHENGGEGPGVLARKNLAAFDATTGAPTAWAPSANGEVLALAASPDGKRIYAGGKFTSVNSSSRGRLAAIKTTTGLVDTTWRPPSFSANVNALAATADRLYVGGAFLKAGLESRSRLAAVSTATAALEPGWVPVADGLVRTLSLSPDGARVYAGGDFSTVSMQARRNAVALGTIAGDVISDWRPDPGQPVFSLVANDASVYGAVGGSANLVTAWDATTAGARWTRYSDGDFQALAVSGNIVYAGGHFNKLEGELRRKLIALDRVSGALRKDWKPKLPATSTTWGGVWALSTSGDTRLVVGGDFDNISGFRQEHFAKFTGSIDGTATTRRLRRSPPASTRKPSAEGASTSTGARRPTTTRSPSTRSSVTATRSRRRGDDELLGQERPGQHDLPLPRRRRRLRGERFRRVGPRLGRHLPAGRDASTG